MNNRKQLTERLLENTQSIGRAVFSHASPGLKRSELTPSQWLALRYVAKHEDTTLKDVAKALGATSSAATQLVEALVRKGYMTRSDQKNDRRSLALRLSEKSKREIETFRKHGALRIEKTFGVLSDEEFEEYCRLIKKVSDAIAETP